MISITNGTQSGTIYPVTFGGDFTLELLNTNSTHYKLEAVGLTPDPFEFSIPKADGQTGGEIDYEKIADWLINEVEPAANGTNISAYSQDIIFTYNSASGGVVTLDISGDSEVDHNDTQNSVFYLTVTGFGENEYDIEIPVSEAGGDENGPDPGDVFRWLLKKLKEYVCPTCL